MNKKIKTLFLLGIMTSFTFAHAAASTKSEETAAKEELTLEAASDLDINKVSEAFGHLIGKNLETLGFEFDIEQVIKGMQDAVAGKDSPLNETECVQAISIVQEEAFQSLAIKNLDEAHNFLKENINNDGIVELEKNMLQYKVEQEGTGAVVESHHTPLIRYTGKFLDGKVFGSSQENELISLDETIKGFSNGIVGMKEGEKRTIFIHPDMGYGMSGYLPPNSLLVFDIEVVKANAAPDHEESLSTIQSPDTLEIADPTTATQESLR